MTGNHIVTERVTWSEAKARLVAIREQVFVKEQNVPMELEMDEHDEHCYHLLARDGTGKDVGTARLLPNGHIGRMAVLAPYRGRGIGSQLLEATVELAKTQGLNTLYLHAQTHAIGFYEKHQFGVVGGEFMEAGIPHVQMRRQL
jgi:predicted GNAT family N-acyltransferase